MVCGLTILNLGKGESMSFIDSGFGTFGMNENHSLPEYYWNVKSQEERIYLICKEIQKIYDQLKSEDAEIEAVRNQMVALQNAFKALENELRDNLSDFEKSMQEQFDYLQSQFDKFVKSGFDEYYKKSVEIWVEQNMQKIWEGITARVFFGLEDGYFVAYIPESWSDLRFSTGVDYGSPEYGRLILEYE